MGIALITGQGDILSNAQFCGQVLQFLTMGHLFSGGLVAPENNQPRIDAPAHGGKRSYQQGKVFLLDQAPHTEDDRWRTRPKPWVSENAAGLTGQFGLGDRVVDHMHAIRIQAQETDCILSHTARSGDNTVGPGETVAEHRHHAVRLSLAAFSALLAANRQRDMDAHKYAGRHIQAGCRQNSTDTRFAQRRGNHRGASGFEVITDIANVAETAWDFPGRCQPEQNSAQATPASSPDSGAQAGQFAHGLQYHQIDAGRHATAQLTLQFAHQQINLISKRCKPRGHGQNNPFGTTAIEVIQQECNPLRTGLLRPNLFCLKRHQMNPVL
tara:strand:- start:8515 stop:9492 length:978 start_codon:yes stop_codon:yes gene_type:complete